MFCAPITFLQYFKDIKPGGLFRVPTDVTGGGKPPPCLTFLKYCQNVICTQNMLIYFRLHCLLYIFNRGVDASKANLLKKALILLRYSINSQREIRFEGLIQGEKAIKKIVNA